MSTTDRPLRSTIPPALALLSLAFAMPANAQIYSGPARTVDGDTLVMTAAKVRLFGIDAPETEQTCKRPDGQTWACGKEAAATLTSLTTGKRLECEQQDVDKYYRVVAICSAGRDDLGALMVGAGLAVALPGFSDRYVEAERSARARRVGIWAGTFDTPADYRAAHPHDFPPPERQTASTRQSPSLGRRAAPAGPSRSDVFFRSCRDAWAAGVAPMRAGQPGYRVGLDGDGDGVACEPFRRR